MAGPLKGGFFELRAEFERCWPWLDESLSRIMATHTKEQIWRNILELRMSLWPHEASASLTRIHHQPIGFSDMITVASGGDLDELKKQFPDYKAWAQAKKCRRIVGYGRRGWMRAWPGEWIELGVHKAQMLE